MNEVRQRVCPTAAASFSQIKKLKYSFTKNDSVRIVVPLSSVIWSHLFLCFRRASSNQVGELFRNARERLHQAAKPSRVWRGHHSCGPCLRQGG